MRSGAYGQSFAMKLLGVGKLDEALAEASKDIERDPADPEAMLDRAQVYLAMERFEDAVSDVATCKQLDEALMILDDDIVDDTLFTALLSWARAVAAGGDGATGDAEAGVKVLARYRDLMPDGMHTSQVEEWTRRLRGERKMWVKPS